MICARALAEEVSCTDQGNFENDCTIRSILTYFEESPVNKESARHSVGGFDAFNYSMLEK